MEEQNLIKDIFTMGGPGVGIGFFFGAALVLKIFLKRLFDILRENNKVFRENNKVFIDLRETIVELKTMLNERLPRD